MLPFKFYNRFFSSHKDFASFIKSVIGFTPSNLEVYVVAFSTKGKDTEKYETYERLEFLGDAVLGSCVAEYLFKKYPKRDEGFLTQMRSKIVRRKQLEHLGKEMELDVAIQIINEGISSSNYPKLGDVLEALIGAIYLDTDYPKTKKFIYNKIIQRLDINLLETVRDPKSLLLEWCQKHQKKLEFKLLKTEKIKYRDVFFIGIYINNKQVAEGSDFNKKNAEKDGAQKAINVLNIE